jgi:cytidylate kinase
MSVIAIDGPAGAGKSTVARRVASRLGWDYLDTGAMYRAVALAALEKGADLEDAEELGRIAAEALILLHDQRVELDGLDVTERIRATDVTRAVSKVSAKPSVRAALVRKQQEAAREADVVMEGRDIGTAVIPDADVKIFMTASLDERARRRWREFDGDEADLEEIRSDIAGRDDADRNRAASPLVPAADAFVLDTTDLDLDGVVEAILDVAREKIDDV